MSYRLVLSVMFAMAVPVGALIHLADSSHDAAAGFDPYDAYARPVGAPCLVAGVQERRAGAVVDRELQRQAVRGADLLSADLPGARALSRFRLDRADAPGARLALK